MPFKGFSMFSYCGHFVQQSGTILVEGHQRTILAILVKGHSPKNISVKLFRNRAIGLREDVI